MNARLASSLVRSTGSSRVSMFGVRSFNSTSIIRATNVTTVTNVQYQEDPNTIFTFDLGENSFETHNCDFPVTTTSLSRKELLDLYKLMVSIRKLEIAADSLYKKRDIRGFCHLSSGQEAIAAGMESAITHDDAIITAYRCHGFTYARGASAFSIIAELIGKEAGCSKGRGGSMHMFASEFYGGNGIVGAQVPIGAGIALKQKYLNQKAMTFSLYGDGAANQGQVFEAYNIAKLWNLPVAFTCENNKYGMGTSAERSAASTKYFTRGDYIPGISVDGMDVLTVREGSKFARDWCVSGKGPIVVEMKTYRYGGHSMSDPGSGYRSKEEVLKMRLKDPIDGLKKRILNAGITSEVTLKLIDEEVKTEIKDAQEKAESSPFPEGSQLHHHIYIKGTEPAFVRGRTPDEIYTY
ncbi:alpha subunit of pyruvate dehydrogenase [Nowakowskiella sp. JEL0078]|nr:alpha subunit of pyruvate dehydrogenase [Nowakowskiella sp. JEL0078]